MINRKKHTDKTPAKQGPGAGIAEPNKIRAATPYDFQAKNLTAYGGLLPVAAMLERLGFQQLVEATLTVKRITRAMPMYQFVLAMVLAAYVGFTRLHHLRFLAREPMLTGILEVLRLPPQCTFWRFLASLHLGVAKQLLSVQRQMRERVWPAAHVGLTAIKLDTDTTVHTLFGNQMGARKGYNPKHKGKRSYQPILTFLAETREYVSGALHNGENHSGAEIARHLKSVFAALPAQVKTVFARAVPRGDPGILLLAGSGRIRTTGRPVHHLRPQDGTFDRGTPSGRLEAVSAHRRRRPMRVLLPTGKAGAKPIGSSPCATQTSPSRQSRKRRSNTNCSTHPSIPIAPSSPA